jgi:hypothetical protein
MPPSDLSDLLEALWRAIGHAGDVERQVRAMAAELAAWQNVARAAITALDTECARHREAVTERTE